MIAKDHEEFDVVVIGCGPGGAITGWRLAGMGLRVLAIEKHGFPRYHIGESLTGLAGDFIRELGIESEMDRLQFPQKSGVKVLGRDAKSEFFVPVLRPTWQVRRAEFDQLLLARAVEAGVVHRYGTVKDVLRSGNAVVGVRYTPAEGGNDVDVRARAVVDASGHSAVLSKLGIAGPRAVDVFGKQVAAFSQLRGARRDPGTMGNNTFIFYSDTYQWAWFIPLSPDVVSIGVVVPSSVSKGAGHNAEVLFRWGLEHINPDLARRVKGCEQVEPCRFIANYSYRIDPFAGDGWLCIGDAHRFADPIFSFGVSSAMLEAAAAADTIAEALRCGDFREPIGRYIEYSNRGQDAIFDVLRYFWSFPAFFGVQSRGNFGKDIIRIFAGDCFDTDQIPALIAMRKSLGLVTESAPRQRTAAVAMSSAKSPS